MPPWGKGALGSSSKVTASLSCVVPTDGLTEVIPAVLCSSQPVLALENIGRFLAGWYQLSSLKLAMMRGFTPQKLASATNQDSIIPQSQLLKHSAAHQRAKIVSESYRRKSKGPFSICDDQRLWMCMAVGRSPAKASLGCWHLIQQRLVHSSQCQLTTSRILSWS